jgi:hypothetical protein
MKQKSDSYARGILSVNVTNFEAWTALFTVWFGLMNCPPAAVSLSQGECRKIKSNAIDVSLSKCGSSHKTARAIVFGSPWFRGLGWRHLHFEQGTQHLLTLIKHLRTPGPFQSLFHVRLHWCQVIAGVSFSPFLHPDTPLPHLDNAWLDSTCQFLKHCSAQLEIPTIPLPVSKRRNDACVMDGFIGLGLSSSTLQRLNFCCLWLRVTHLSGICTLAGDCVDRTAWLGLDPMPSSAADWPMQPRPHDTVWSLWRQALSDSVCSKTHRCVRVTRHGTLTSPLGNWCADCDPQASPRWTSLFSQSTQSLFVPDRHQPACFRQLSASTRLAFHLGFRHSRQCDACSAHHQRQLAPCALNFPPNPGASCHFLPSPHPGAATLENRSSSRHFPGQRAQSSLSTPFRWDPLASVLRWGGRSNTRAGLLPPPQRSSGNAAVAQPAGSQIPFVRKASANLPCSHSWKPLPLIFNYLIFLFIMVLHQTLGSASPLTTKASGNASPLNSLRPRSLPVLA